MRKYWQVMKNTWEDYFMYRLSFVLWRLRNFLVFFLSVYFFWSALFQNHRQLFGYTRQEMMTYLVLTAFLRSLVLGSRSNRLAGQIRKGDLTATLLKPVSVRGFWLASDLADKLLNLLFSAIEVGFAVFLLRLTVSLPEHFSTYLWTALFAVLGLFTYFFFSFTISVLAFWTQEVWATRFLLEFVFLQLLSGALFPLDAFPEIVRKVAVLTPFPYLIFFPARIWLEQVSLSEIGWGATTAILWLVTLMGVSHYLWRRGLKDYSSFGG